MADALTADLPKTGSMRSGAIVLARHGEPDIHRKVMLNAHGYREYWSRYEQLGIRPGQQPPATLIEQTARAGVIISSVRNRSIESALAWPPAASSRARPCSWRRRCRRRTGRAS